jgi:hypothetical protein
VGWANPLVALRFHRRRRQVAVRLAVAVRQGGRAAFRGHPLLGAIRFVPAQRDRIGNSQASYVSRLGQHPSSSWLPVLCWQVSSRRRCPTSVQTGFSPHKRIASTVWISTVRSQRSPKYIGSDVPSANYIAGFVCRTTASIAAFIEHDYQESLALVEEHKTVVQANAQALIDQPETHPR